MYGVCATCGKPVSTKKTVHCKQCYRRNIQEQNENRDKKIIHLITSEEHTAAQVARDFQISREAVRLILSRNKVDYTSIWLKRINQKKQAKQEGLTKNRTRNCAWCGIVFEINKNGARVKYCCDEHKKLRQQKLQRERIKEYYRTPKGKQVQKLYAQKHKDKIRVYFRNWMDQKTKTE